MSNVVKWIVEEKSDSGAQTYLQEFNSYEEALDVYTALKEENKNSFVSIEKSVKRLLTE